MNPMPGVPPSRDQSHRSGAGIEVLTHRQSCTAPPPQPPRVAELFAGIGGFSLAFETVGATTVFASENNPDARRTFEANFRQRLPAMFGHGHFVGDIRAVAARDVPRHDILTAGFPCQPFSEAGVRRGFADRRGELFFDVVRILDAARPAAFFLENVRGLLTHQAGRTIDAITGLLHSLGYQVHLKVVRACDFGLPQLRPRVFIVGFRRRSTRFAFPEPVPLTTTMDHLLGGNCVRKIGKTILASGYNKPLTSRFNWSHYLVDGAVRQIGVREARLMQGFPDNFVFPVSEAATLRLLGNAVAINPVAATAREIARSLGFALPAIAAPPDLSQSAS